MKIVLWGRWLLGVALLVAAMLLVGYSGLYPLLTAAGEVPTSTKGAEMAATLTLATETPPPALAAGVALSPATAGPEATTTQQPETSWVPVTPALLPAFAEFSRAVEDGQTGVLRGLYVAGLMALRIVQQPKGEGGFISTEAGTATQFQNADAFQTVGLLAHNTLAGKDFFGLQPGQDLVLIYGDGRAEHFRVADRVDYQRLTRADLRSNFLELATGKAWTADEVFAHFYRQAHRLTLQTCLKRDEMADWGVHFVVAVPAPSQSAP